MPVISTNTAANSAVRYLNINSQEQSASLSKLASGSRINKASDDAAGLAIATRIQSEITALEQAATNASHGISVLQTADGGASNIGDILQRMKSLGSQAASGTVTDTERTYIQAEFAQLIEEVDGTATSTRYNGQSLLDGTSEFATGVTVMVGSDSSDTISVKISSLTSLALGLSSAAPTAAADLVGGAAGYDATGGNVSFDVNGVTVALTTTGGTAGVYSAAQIATAINTALAAAVPPVTTVSAVGTGPLTISNSAYGNSLRDRARQFHGGSYRSRSRLHGHVEQRYRRNAFGRNPDRCPGRAGRAGRGDRHGLEGSSGARCHHVAFRVPVRDDRHQHREPGGGELRASSTWTSRPSSRGSPPRR